MIANSVVRDSWRAYTETLRPLPRLSPSAFAARYRNLSEVEAEQPGPWSNDYFPYLGPIMDSIEEALQKGKRGWCMIKAGQGGGTTAAGVNAWTWLQAYYPGPILFMTSKDDIAKEFGRERFSHAIRTTEPIMRKALLGKAGGESLTIKRFTDGKLVLCGGQSVLNLQSQPYRFVILDEIDSLMDEIKNAGDPVALAQVRLDSYFGEKLLIGYAHPSTKDRGAAKLYYQLSDQRRGFVSCIHCGGEFWLQWAHVKAVAPEGMNQQQAALDPKCYEYHCPCCSVEIADAERISMVRKVKYKSVLDPVEAERRTWIGVHFSQLYMANQSIRILAEKWISCVDSEAAKRVFFNKILGEPYETAVEESTPDQWRRLIIIPRFHNDPEAYSRGQVPPGVRFLTGGQDSRSEELHYVVWGWGLRRTVEKYTVLCGWLIDWGVVPRPKNLEITESDLHVFDQLIYQRGFPATYRNTVFRVRQCGHDTGYSPLGVNKYCSHWPERAIPIKGGADTNISTAPAVRPGSAATYLLDGQIFRDDNLRLLILNTFALKTDFSAMLHKSVQVFDGNGETPGPARTVPRLILPADVDDRYITESSNEHLIVIRKTRSGRDEKKWKAKGPNHYWDCNNYSYALALNLDPFQQGLPFDEAAEGPAEQEVIENETVKTVRRRY